MSDTLPLEDRLPLIEGRIGRAQMNALAQAAPAAVQELVANDAPWLLAQVQRLLREQAADRRQIAGLKQELGEAAAKIRRQAGALTTLQQAEGRRQARGRP